MDGHVILAGFCLAGAALALWLLLRFPQAGPRRLTSVLLAVLAVGLGLSLAGPLVGALTEFRPFGAAIALLAVVLPTLTFAFWVAGCVIRVLAELPGVRR